MLEAPDRDMYSVVIECISGYLETGNSEHPWISLLITKFFILDHEPRVQVNIKVSKCGFPSLLLTVLRCIKVICVEVH